MTVPILIATLRGADYMNFDMGKVYMMIMVAIVPIIIMYLLLSKYIIAGVTLGGVKRIKDIIYLGAWLFGTKSHALFILRNCKTL